LALENSPWIRIGAIQLRAKFLFREQVVAMVFDPVMLSCATASAEWSGGCAGHVQEWLDDVSQNFLVKQKDAA